MLILTRKPGESLYIGDTIKVTIVEIKGHQIRVGIEAPVELRIYREEIYFQILEENRKAAEASMTAEVGLDSLSAAWSERKPPETGKIQVESSGETEGKEGADHKPVSPLAGEQKIPRIPGFSSFYTSKTRESEPQVVIKRKRNKKPNE